MDRTTMGLLTFFLGGVFIYILARMTKPWAEKHHHFFWLIVLSPLVLTLFVLPGLVSEGILNGINALVAGLAFSEYIRTKQKSKLDRLKKLGDDVKAHRENALNQGEAGKPRSAPGKNPDKKTRDLE